MQQPEEFTGEQSLQLIESMINRAKNHFSENGHLYLLWGWVVFLCSIAQFALDKIFKYEKSYMVWMITWVVVIYQVIYLKRNRRSQRVKTYANHLINFVWITFAITMLLMGFQIANTLHEMSYKLLNPVFLTLYGIPTFLTGIIVRFKPLVIGGISCWILSLASNFIPYDYHVLMISAAMLVAWIIPGYLLRAKFNKEQTA